MGIAANIVSVILKSVVGDKLGSGFAKEIIGISIDGISEKGINEITDFINDERSKIDNILSRENMKSMNISEDNIDYVIVEVKDLLSRISITDEVLRQCKYDSMNLSVFFWNEYKEGKNDCIECESEIKRCLFTVAEALIDLMRKSENFEKDVLIHISNSVDAMMSQEQISSQNVMKRFDRLEESNQEILNRVNIKLNLQYKSIKQKKVKSRTQEYADIWNKNMFLNNFDEWDEDTGVNVKLSDVYIDKHLPHFKSGHNEKEFDNLDFLLSKHITKNNENKMLLILGQPGIGKSTLITWITANFANRINDILVYRFASDLGNTDWENGRISNRVLEELGLDHSDLTGKILILDGFDEVSIEASRRRDILDSLYGDWIYNKTIDKFSLIITCRENYVLGFERIKCKYITLQSWDEMQIRSFCNIFQEKTRNIISNNTIKKLLKNKEILGIPLILYMVLALNISIEKEGSIVDVYDKIFSLEGGIYDRCIDNKNFADIHRISETKEQIHQISREIAIWMFENNSEKANIPKKNYKEICENVKQKQGEINENIKQDFLIGNFFKLKHCEGTKGKELYFVHRSIYEYFVAETIYKAIENAMIILSDVSQIELAKNIPIYLKKGSIINTISEYLKFKILKLYNGLEKKKQKRFYQWWEEAIGKMMDDGMFFYTGDYISNYKNIISKEIRCFLNLINVLRVLMKDFQKEYILEDESNKVQRYIKYSCATYEFREELNLSTLFLKEASFPGVNFEYADLSGAYLPRAFLTNAYLPSANLSGTVLKRAHLKGAKLMRAKLVKADLQGADLRGANLEGADVRGIELEGATLAGTNINFSIWESNDIKKALGILEYAKFEILLIEEQNQRNEIFRRNLFERYS